MTSLASMARTIAPAIGMVLLLLFPVVGSLGAPSDFVQVSDSSSQYTRMEWTMEIPNQVFEAGPEVPWWERTTLDNDPLEDNLFISLITILYFICFPLRL